MFGNGLRNKIGLPAKETRELSSSFLLSSWVFRIRCGLLKQIVGKGKRPSSRFTLDGTVIPLAVWQSSHVKDTGTLRVNVELQVFVNGLSRHTRDFLIDIEKIPSSSDTDASKR